MIPEGTLGFVLLAGLTLGTVSWGVHEFRTARDGRQRAGMRRVALYHALLLDSFGTAFSVMALARLWPGLPPGLALVGLAPAFGAAMGVRFSDRFAGWLLEQIEL